MRSVLRATFGALTACLLWASVADAAKVSGRVIDPRADIPAIAEEQHPRDLRSFRVVYDGERGRVRATVRHWDPQTYEPGYVGYHWFDAGADLGTVRSDGTCDTTSTGSVSTRMIAPNDGYGFGDDEPGIWAAATIAGEASALHGSVTGGNDENRWTYTLRSTALRRRGYDCVANVRVRHFGSDTVDTAASFCMGPSGTRKCPVAGPAVGTSRFGARLPWAALGAAVAFGL